MIELEMHLANSLTCKFKISYREKNVILTSLSFRLNESKQNNSGKTKLFATFTEMNDSKVLTPPENVNGMKILDRDAFKKSITVSCLEVKISRIQILINPLKKYMLKLLRIKPVQLIDDGKHRILLNPDIVKSFNDFNDDVKEKLENLEISKSNFASVCLNVGYENWSAESIIKAVLPKNEPPLTSYSLIGHIIHLNIKEHLLEYKHVMAQILLDKVPFAKTVVYKKNIIDNVYRNFEMEVLCGEPNFVACIIEFGVKLEFDFSKVYWNPRLATEHDRIVNQLEARDVLFDVFAGVGPFSIRAAIKQCTVFANDLNPDSFKWLNHNIKLNKRSKAFIQTFNKDGVQFILNDIKENLLKIWTSKDFNGKIHVVMNLPNTALTFLKYFKNLFTEKDLVDVELTDLKKRLPIIHCYFFVKYPDTVKEVFEKNSLIEFDENKHKIYFVRAVAHGKGMYRVMYEMPMKYILAFDSDSGEPLPKRNRTVQ